MPRRRTSSVISGQFLGASPRFDRRPPAQRTGELVIIQASVPAVGSGRLVQDLRQLR